MAFLVNAAKGVLKIAGDIVEGIGDAVAGVLDAALSDPVGTIAKVAAVATGNVWALPLIDGATVLAKGGDLGDALKSAAISYATGKVASTVGNAVGAAAAKSTGSALAGKIIGAGAGGATVAIVTGQSPLKAFATGGLTAGVPAVLGKIDGFAEFQKTDPTTANAISTAITAQLTGKDPTDALINGVITASGIVKDAITAFDPNNKLTGSQKAVLSNALLASTTAAVQGKDVTKALSASLKAAGVKALGDMVTSGFAKTGDAVFNAQEALDKNAAAIEVNINNQQTTADEFNTVKAKLDAAITKQNTLYDEYAEAKKTFDADNTNETKYKTAQKALDDYNAFVTELTTAYNDYYQPTLAALETKLTGYQTEYKKLEKETGTLNTQLKDAIDAVGAGNISAVDITNKELVKALDPEFDAAAYAKLNGVTAEQVYEDYLDKGQFAGALTNYDDYVTQKLSAVEEYDKDFNQDEFDAAIKAVLGAKDLSAANKAVDAIAARIDASSTTRDEAIQFWKDAYATAGFKDYTPTEDEINSVINKSDAESYTTAIRVADAKSVTFDGTGYASKNDAAEAALAAGYNTVYYKGQEYTLQSPKEVAEVNAAREKLVTAVLAEQGKTLGTATDAEFNAALAKVNKVPTAYLKTATLQDVLTSKYTQLPEKGDIPIEVRGTTAIAESPNAATVSKMLPDGAKLAKEDEVWGDSRDPNARLEQLPDGTLAWVIPGKITPAASKAYGHVDELAETDPEAWLQFASQYEKDADGDLSDFFVNMANSAMLGAYATGDKEFGDDVKQTLSIATQAVGEQTASFAQFFASVTGTSYNNALARAGQALQDWGAANQTQSTKDQEKAILDATSKAEGVMGKINAFLGAAIKNPGGFATMIAKEGIQEALPMWAAKSLYRMGKVAYYSGNAALNGMESWGANAGDTYANAIKQGRSDEEARALATKVGFQSAVVTFVTDGVGDIPMLRAMAKDVIKDAVGATSKSAAANGLTEYFDEMLQNASQQYALTGTVNWDQASTAGTIGMGIGAGVGSGLTSGIKLYQNIEIARDAKGNPITMAEFLSGSKVADMSTFDVNAQIGTAKDGDAITVGSVLAMPMSNGVSYDLVTAGAPNAITNQNFTVGKDALGNDVTLAELMGQVTAGVSYDDAYKSLLNTTAEERVEAQTDFLTTALESIGYKPTKTEIQSLISADPAGSDAITKAAESYADQHTVTYQEAEQLLKNAYAEQGFKNYAPSKAEVEKYVASGADVNPTAVEKGIGTDVGKNTVTAAEAEQIFKDTYGYTPSKEEVKQFTAVINEDTQREAIGQYVDPLQVTYEEAKQFLLDNGYTASKEEIEQFVAQTNEAEQAQNIAGWADPRVVDEQEVRDAIAAMGLTDIVTDAQVASLVGQYEEAKLAGLTQEAAPGFIYEALKGDISGLKTGYETLGGEIADLSADTNAKYAALSDGQKALADSLTQQGVDLTNAIEIASQQNQEQIQALNDELQSQIGMEGRAVTQEDIDALTQMLAGEQEINQQYDVNQDNQITQEDIDLLTDIVANNKTDWNAPVGSIWAPTGLRGDLYASEQQRIADAKATQEAIRQASIQNQRTTLGAMGAQQVQNVMGQMQQLPQMVTTTTTPIYGGAIEDFNLGAPLDVGFFSPNPAKTTSQTSQQATKMATGGYLDDLLTLLK